MKNIYFKCGHFLILILCLLLSTGNVISGNSDDLHIIFPGGMEYISNGDNKIGIIIGEPFAGIVEYDTIQIGLGFWEIYGCCDKAGDYNGDDNVNILDVVSLINYKYKSGPPPYCFDEANVNGDDDVNILDVVYLINFKYKGGPPPSCGTSGSK